ncbi:chaperone DnaJ (macronuclear) [Tetrahymena thermophila SB210]|uniref:Chaperone DnaJ n=1 Tax=Tetrahymena thermophila (strain SB210) TaxID=312017 RepID=Q234F1_TETTS|nr:chaperone DnaJ [Tetrahymena thermophila SB210]EAR92052.1 chaperone DnaJ [Tetrahymena thermophila SB210]|eukprot:XP_001012297.1 chaperone DnaJ [Tetrahymena thermophila SB210]
MKIRLIHLLVFFNAAVFILANQKNPYKVLGLPTTATDEQIQKKFRELSKKYHPDINKDPKAAEVYSEITSAYEILSNPTSKQKYFDEVDRQNQRSNQFNFQNWGYQNYGYHQNSQVKQQNYKKKWNELFQKRHSQSYQSYYQNKKRSYQPSSTSKFGWIKDKLSSLLFGGGFSDILIYGAIIFLVIKLFGNLVHVQMI